MVATSDGSLSFDRQPLARMGVSVAGARRRRDAAARLCRRRRACVARLLPEREDTGVFAREAVRQAIVQLGAIPAPAGEMTVVLGPGWPGILLHEAVGHGLEADFNRKGVSAFSGSHRPAGGESAVHRRRRWHDRQPTRIAERR